MKIKVSDYYRDELFKFMPEDMFDLLDEAYFMEKSTVEVPENLIEQFEKNKQQIN